MLEAGFYNMDCMDGMAQFPDKFFSLAIVDPPYGIGANKMQLGNGHRTIHRGSADWDSHPPNDDYFRELYRISANQIIWGANHFPEQITTSRGWVFWDKGTGDNDYSDGELAWTSFDRPLRKFVRSWVGANAKERNESDRIHPTQKPIALYKWLLSNYAKPGDKILDTHVGSASSLIACHQMGFEYWGFELDADYYNAATERLNKVKAQVSMTELIEQVIPEQVMIGGEYGH